MNANREEQLNWLGKTIESGEQWALLVDGKIQDVFCTADRVIAELSGCIGSDEKRTREFMRENGWLLVRVTPMYRVEAVLVPNGQGQGSLTTENAESAEKKKSTTKEPSYAKATEGMHE